MSAFHYFESSGGLFTGMRGSSRVAPPGHGAIAAGALPADFHWRMFRVLVDGSVERYEPPAPDATAIWAGPDKGWITVAMHAEGVRSQRDLLLRQCDWLVARAFESGQPLPDAWRVYRQALRDVTRQPGFPVAVQWPEAPAT